MTQHTGWESCISSSRIPTGVHKKASLSLLTHNTHQSSNMTMYLSLSKSSCIFSFSCFRPIQLVYSFSHSLTQPNTMMLLHRSVLLVGVSSVAVQAADTAARSLGDPADILSYPICAVGRAVKAPQHFRADTP